MSKEADHLGSRQLPEGVSPAPTSYGATARALHWIMAILVILQITAGLIIAYKGPEPNIWAALTNRLALYDSHKVLGLILFLLVVVRLANRIVRGAPADDPQIKTWQREISHLVHAWIYFLLIGVPLLGWIGISLYPALVVFSGLHLPALLPANQAASTPVFVAHALAAYGLSVLICMHISAAIFHHFIERDGTLRRMLPGLRALSD